MYVIMRSLRQSSQTWLMPLQIHLLEVILQILVLSGKCPADLGDSLIEVPLKGQDTPVLTGKWSIFEDWFYHLLQHQYFWEAQRILRSLFYVLPRLQYVELVQHYMETAVRTNVSQDPVKIAASSLVQHFLYAIESEDPNPPAVVQWNDAVTWALFGITLTEAGVEPASLPSRICLRLSLPEKLGLKLSLPLDGAHEKHQPDDYMSKRLYSLHELTPNKETSRGELDHFYWETLNIAMCLCGIYDIGGPHYIKKSCELDEDDVFSWALLHVAQYCPGNLPLSRGILMNSRTVNTQDSYKRTPLHWASLNGQIEAVETLLREDDTGIGRLDWFGFTPLHYAVKSCPPGRETGYGQVVEALLKFDSAAANTKDSRGLTPLRTAIQKEFYEVAESLLRHGAIVENSDYHDLLWASELHLTRARLLDVYMSRRRNRKRSDSTGDDNGSAFLQS